MLITREEAKELLPIIKAFAEGKKVESKTDKGEWKDFGDYLDIASPFSLYEPEDFRIVEK